MFLYSRTSATMSALFRMSSKTSLVFLTGNWNAKVGKRSNSIPVTNNNGDRNSNAQHLFDFCAINNLFISNTAFQFKAADIPTWKNKRVYPKDLLTTITVYNQVHYIVCNEKIKHTLINARIFSGMKNQGFITSSSGKCN